MFAGDSPNDQPMFAFFPNAVGVANVREMADLMTGAAALRHAVARAPRASRSWPTRSSPRADQPASSGSLPMEARIASRSSRRNGLASVPSKPSASFAWVKAGEWSRLVA